MRSKVLYGGKGRVMVQFRLSSGRIKVRFRMKEIGLGLG